MQGLIEQGVVSDDQRHNHPTSNIITRAVGATQELQLERRFSTIDDEDIFLLCSDGLTGCLNDDEIARYIIPSNLDASANQLMSATLSKGAFDNISLVIIRAELSQVLST